MTKNNSQKEKELIELGAKLQSFFEMGYVSKKQALGFSFLKGLAGGFGAFIGGTLVIALLLWSLSLFDQTPFIGEVVRSVQQNIDKND